MKDRWCRRSSPPRPPWWPEEERWAPAPPPSGAPSRLRRGAFVVGFVVFLVVVGTSIGVEKVVGDNRDRPGDEGPGPLGLVGVIAVGTVVATTATRRAYRRLAAPAGELVEAAARVGQGDYDAHVEPRGPRELRDLMARFNEMTARLRGAEEQRRRVLADVTHELRTPLMVLQSRIEAQLDGVHPRDDEHLAALLDATRALGVLVNDLHTLALAEAGRLPLHRETVDPAVLAEDVVESVSAVAGDVEVQLLAHSDLPTLEVDPTRVRQVLTNLLTNAVRHTPPTGVVQVRVEAAEGGVRFCVADTGPGIRPDQLETIFEPFARASDTGGSGLGLAISRDIVRAHGGTISAENRPDGATVSFLLPSPGTAD